MRKKDAALDLLAVAKLIADSSTDEDSYVWVSWLLSTARRLDPALDHPYYWDLILFEGGNTREAKLRRLIEHPDTRSAERDAAVAALARVRAER